MQKVALATFRNQFFRDSLARSGFSLLEINLPLSDEYIKRIPPSGKVEYVIFELTAENRASLESLQGIYSKARFVVITDEVDKKLREYLFNRSIVDLFAAPEADEPADYIRVLSAPSDSSFGKIILYDTDPRTCFYINSICRGFGYNVITVDNTEDLYEKITLPTVQAALVNLDTEKLRLKDLVARSYSCKQFKSTPVIIYKDMTKGIFVHEIVSGLNRITSCIVDFHELFSFLVLNLFKKRMIPVYSSLGRILQTDANALFAADPLSRIIFSRGSDLFDGEECFTPGSVRDMGFDIDSMTRILTLMKGMVWMVDLKKEDVVTCGAGAAGLHHP